MSTVGFVLLAASLWGTPAATQDKVNTLRLEAATPKGDARPIKEWEPYAESVEMTHAALGKQYGNWVLLFTNGPGKDTCAEIMQSSGHLIVSLYLPGPPDLSAKSKPVEPTDAGIHVKQFSVNFPLSAMSTKSITFTPSGDSKAAVIRGTVNVSGKYVDVDYRITGSFAAKRCW
jgi:hypothetical protein